VWTWYIIRNETMNDSIDSEDTTEGQLEIVELLDERFRLREDPTRAVELEVTHARLRERLHGPERTKTSESD
jgi:hypothetical protein